MNADGIQGLLLIICVYPCSSVVKMASVQQKVPSSVLICGRTLFVFFKGIFVNRKIIVFFILSCGAAPFGLADEIKMLKEVPSTFVYPADGFLPFNIHRATPTLLSLMVSGAAFNDPRGVACALLRSDHDPHAPLNDVVITVIGVNSGAGEIYYNI